MTIAKHLITCLVVLVLVACVEQKPTDSSKSRLPVSSDLASFRKYVNLPAEPRAVLFQTFNRSNQRVPGPTDWYLLALLTYDQSSASAITQKTKQSEPMELDADEIPHWLPDSVKTSLIKTPTGYRFPGQAYQAGSFAKSPLNDGEFVVSGDYVFLRLDCCTAKIE